MFRLSRVAPAVCAVAALVMAPLAGPASADDTDPATTAAVSADPAITTAAAEETATTEATEATETTEDADAPAAASEDEGSPTELTDQPSPTDDTDETNPDLEATPDEPNTPAAPAAPGTPSGTSEATPDVKVSATVPDTTYLMGDTIPVTITITNVGGADATGVTGHIYGTDEFWFSDNTEDWGEFSWYGRGGTIAAGETVVLTVTGEVTSWTGGPSHITVWMDTPWDPNWDDNWVYDLPISVVSPSVTDTVAGVVFGDANGNGTFDPGEGLGGVNLNLGGPTYSDVTTAADGSFAFTDLPAGLYSLSTFEAAPGGWVVPDITDLRLDGSGRYTDLVIATERPLTDSLSAQISFDKDRYQPGDVASLTITLTNTGPVDLSGIMANCDRFGGSHHLQSPQDWGDLGYPGPGATVGAGETITFHATGTVPNSAADYGYVYVHCDFGPALDKPIGYPDAYAQAKVPGKKADTSGVVYQDRDGNGWFDDGEGVAKVRVGLVDPDTGKVVARTSTDAEGHAEFTDVPTGLYRLQVYGPWKIVGDDTARAIVGRPDLSGWQLRVERGPNVPEPGGDVPPTPITEPPATQPPAASGGTGSGGGPGGLASTGVDAVTLGTVGLLTVLAGLGAVLLTRRRREAA